MLRTTSTHQLFDWCRNLHFDSTIFEVWIPKQFIDEIVLSNDSISVIRGGSNFYQLSLGLEPYLDPRVSSFSILRTSRLTIPTSYKQDGEWDAYFLTESNFKKVTNHAVTPESDFRFSKDEKYLSQINNFIDEHAPDSSVRFGDSEVLEWICLISLNQKRLVGIAAICRWQSGFIVISSVAVDSALRGKGIGKTLMYETCQRAFPYVDRFTYALSAERNKGIALGVLASNKHAKSLYESLGFYLIGQMRSYSRVEHLLVNNFCCDS